MNSWIIQNRTTRPFAAALIALVAFAVLTSPILTAYAAAPVNAISYQGRLLDSAGNPVSDASAEFVFRFFGSAAGADCLWESDDGIDCDAGDETQTVAINDGLFSENIGSTVDPDGLSVSYPEDLAGVFENNSDVYLEVVINGETLSPRKQIVAAPFALNSQSLDGLDSTDFLSDAGDTATGVYDFTGATIFGGSALSFDGATADGFTTTFDFEDPLADRTITFRELDGTVALLSDIPAGSSLWESDVTSTFENDANVFIGSDTLGAVEAAFVPDGDDLYVAGDIAAQFDIYADKFVAGDASTTFEDGAITTGGITDFTLNIAGGDLAFGQDTVIGDGGDNITINSAGNVFIDDTNLTGTGSLAIGAAANTSLALDAAGGAGVISVGSSADATTILIASGAGADTVEIGSAIDTITIESDTLSLTDDDWNVDASGAASFASVTLGALPSTLLMTDGSGTLVAATAGTDYMTGALADNNVFIGNGAGVATAVTLSGDVTSTNLGVLTIGSGKVNSDKILNDSIVDADINSAAAIALSKIASGASIITSLAPPSGTNANGGSIAANVLTLSLADDVNPGVVSTGPQTFAGNKTFLGDIAVNGGDITSTATLTLNSSGTVQLGTNDSLSATGSVTSALVDSETVDISWVPTAFDTSGNAMTITTSAAHDDTPTNTNYGLHVIQADSGLSPEYGADALIYLENTASDGPAAGLLIGGGTIGYAIDLSPVTVGIDMRLTNTETLDNLTDDLVVLSGTGGTDNTDIRFDLDGTMPIIDSPTDGDISIGTSADNLLVGATSKTGVKATFDLSGGDIYANGDIAAQFNMYADSFTAGDASTTFGDGSVTTGGATDLSFAIGGGDLTFAQNTVIGDGGDVLSMNSSDWDIGTTGNLSGIGTIGADGDFTTSADVNVNGGDLATTAGTFNVANAATTLNLGSTNIARTVNLGSGTGIDAINIGTGGTAVDVIRIGDALADVAVTDANWSISNIGTATFASISSTSMAGDLNMATNVITNIGNALTDFTGTGGLTLAGAFTASDTVDVNGLSTFNTDMDFLLDGTENVQLTSATGASSVNALRIRLENTDAVGAGAQQGIYLTNESNATVATTESLITLDNLDSDALTDALNISSTGTITDAIDASAANIVNALNVGANTILGTAGVIDFTEFDVSGTDGSVTINDVGTDAGKLSVEGTGLDINSLDFVGVGSITTAGGQTLTLDSASGAVEGGVGDDFTVRAASSGDDSFNDSPSIFVRGSYDALAGVGTTPTNYNTSIQTNLLTAGASPTARLEFNLNGGGVEMSVNELGNLTAIGGASFGDGTNVDKFDFTSIATVTDILTVTANSTVAQTAGSAVLIQRAHSGATNFTSSAGLLNVSMLDTDSASTGPAAKFINEGSGSSIFVDANGNTGGTVSDAGGGALHIANTGNTGYGLSVYSNQSGSSTSLALSKFYAANTGWDGYVMEIESGATAAGSANGSALHIIQNEVDDPALNSTGTQALIIDINMTDPGNGNGDNDEVAMIIRSATDNNNKIMFDYDGDVHADGSFSSTASDIAERYPSTDALTEGDLVRMDPAGTGVLLTSSPNESTLFGAVSTRPGVLLGAEDSGYKVALSGRVPVKVNDENGAIEAGDPVTSSSVAGQGMRSSGAGMIVGFALEDYLGTGPGSISVFINPQFYTGSVLSDDGSATVVSDALALGATGTADATTMGFSSNAFELRGSGWDGGAAQDAQMSLATEVTTASDYRLSIKNTGGSEVAYVSQAGDMALSGRLYPSDRGMLQTSKYIYYDGSSGSGGDFMRTNASGWATGSYDFAEMFPSVDALEAGDVVMFGTTNESVLKSTGSSASLAGIVSTRPGFLAGENTAGHFPIALAGRVPTKVSLENGPIAIGDPLTASTTKGYAMKANASGPIVGYALEAYSGAAGADDMVIAFVNAGYWAGGPVSPTPGTSNSASTIIVRQDADNLTTLNMEGNIYMAGNDILGVGRIAGLSDRWSLEEDGTIKTAAAFKTVIESYQGEMVETTAVTSPDVQITLVGSATLENGEAVIRFEDASPSFNDVTSTTAPIRVIVTPNGPVSLYVYEKNNDGFGVRQMNGSDSGITFDWMVSAFRKDYEPAETAAAEEPVVVDEPIVEETEQAPIAEPVEEEIVVSDPAVEVTEPIVDETVPLADSTESNSIEPEPAP